MSERPTPPIGAPTASQGSARLWRDPNLSEVSVARPPIDDGVILLTGASSGIGLELARLLAPRARVLILVARRRERLASLREALLADRPSLVVDVRPCDLTQRAEVAAMFDAAEAEHGRIDVLINNAGMGDLGLFERAAPEKIERMLELNVVALTALTRRAVGPMIARGAGGVLNVSSGFGLTWMPAAAAYVGSKHYVTAFTESLRTELWGSGVAISQSCPGPVATEFEAIAGNPVGRPVPGWLQIDAARCARESLRAFERGRALVVPGLAAKILIGLGRISPSWVLRLLYAPAGRMLRGREG